MVILVGCNATQKDSLGPKITVTSPISPLVSPVNTSAATGGVSVIKTAISPVEVPKSGQVTIKGKLMSRDTNSPLGDVTVYLAHAQWNTSHTDGVFSLDINTAPTTKTQADGSFVFTNTAAGDYVFVAGSLYSGPVIVSDSNGRPRVFSAPVGKVTDLGILSISYHSG